MCPVGYEVANALSHHCTQAVICWRALLKGLPVLGIVKPRHNPQDSRQTAGLVCKEPDK